MTEPVLHWRFGRLSGWRRVRAGPGGPPSQRIVCQWRRAPSRGGGISAHPIAVLADMRGMILNARRTATVKVTDW